MSVEKQALFTHGRDKVEGIWEHNSK